MLVVSLFPILANSIPNTSRPTHQSWTGYPLKLCDQTLSAQHWSLNGPPYSWGAFKDSQAGEVCWLWLFPSHPITQTDTHAHLWAHATSHNWQILSMLSDTQTRLRCFRLCSSTNTKKETESEWDRKRKGRKRYVFFYLLPLWNPIPHSFPLPLCQPLFFCVLLMSSPWHWRGCAFDTRPPLKTLFSQTHTTLFPFFSYTQASVSKFLPFFFVPRVF